MSAFSASTNASTCFPSPAFMWRRPVETKPPTVAAAASGRVSRHISRMSSPETMNSRGWRGIQGSIEGKTSLGTPG